MTYDIFIKYLMNAVEILPRDAWRIILFPDQSLEFRVPHSCKTEMITIDGLTGDFTNELVFGKNFPFQYFQAILAVMKKTSSTTFVSKAFYEIIREHIFLLCDKFKSIIQIIHLHTFKSSSSSTAPEQILANRFDQMIFDPNNTYHLCQQIFHSANINETSSDEISSSDEECSIQ